MQSSDAAAVDRELSADEWTPPVQSFKVGQRVIVKMSGECAYHGGNGSSPHMRTGTIYDDLRIIPNAYIEEIVAGAVQKALDHQHFWVIFFDKPLSVEPDGARIQLDECASSELELIEARP